MDSYDLKLLAKNKDANALHKLACFYLDDDNDKNDKELGEECLRLAVSKGHEKALYDYGEKFVVNGKVHRGLKYLKLAAKKKHFESVFLLGRIYRGDFDDDFNAYINEPVAAKYFVDAFKMNKEASWEALLDINPLKYIKDIQLIDSIIEEGMSKDSPKAHYFKAELLLETDGGIDKHFSTIVEHYKVALSNGYFESAEKLFYIYHSDLPVYGNGRHKDQTKAYEYYKHVTNHRFTSGQEERFTEYGLPVSTARLSHDVIPFDRYKEYVQKYIKRSKSYDFDFIEWFDIDKVDIDLHFEFETVTEYSGHNYFVKAQDELFFGASNVHNDVQSDEYFNKKNQTESTNSAWYDPHRNFVAKVQEYDEFIDHSEQIEHSGDILYYLQMKDVVPSFSLPEDQDSILDEIEKQRDKGTIKGAFGSLYSYSLVPYINMTYTYKKKKYQTTFSLHDESTLKVPNGPLRKDAAWRIKGVLRHFSFVNGLHKLLTYLLMLSVSVLALEYTIDGFQSSFTTGAFHLWSGIVVGIIILIINKPLNFKRPILDFSDIVMMYDLNVSRYSTSLLSNWGKLFIRASVMLVIVVGLLLLSNPWLLDKI